MDNRQSVRAVAAILMCFACAVPLHTVGQHTGAAVAVDRDGAHATGRRFDGEPSHMGSGPGPTDDRELKRDYTDPDRHKVLRIHLPPPRGNIIDKPGDKPTRIGFHRSLPATLAELTPSLDWAPLHDGRLVATAIVTSPGAVSIRLGMVGALGEGTQIRVFAPDADRAPLPIVTRTHFHDNENGADSAAMLWSPSVPGDTIGVEITLPKSERSAFSLTIARLAHRYRTVDDPPVSKHLQCPLDHVDVQCRADAFPEGLEDATARVTIEKEEGTVTCSGTLVNSDDFPAPFFLTANHCVASDEEAHSIETTWFHERPTCYSAAVSLGETVSGGADLLATSFSYDSTLLLLRRAPPAGAYFAGWEGREIEFRDHPLPVFGIHHPAGVEKKYSSGATVGRGDALIAKDAIAVYWGDGLIEEGSSGSGLFKDDGSLIGVASTTVATCEGQVSHYGALATFFPAACPWLLRDTICTSSEIPFFSGAADPVRQGFVRIVNHSGKPGSVFVYATDDAGRRVGPVTIPIGAGSVAQFNSEDLEMGNADKGIEQGVGPGQGDWRLQVTSTVDVEALAYIRTQDGFVTSMHELVESVKTGEFWTYYIRFFNPGRNRNQVSALRLVNPHQHAVAVAIAAVDDGGRLGQDFVAFELMPGEARKIDARQLETGGMDFVGMLGRGQGKWRLAVGASRQIDVMNLLESPTGNFANLSVGRRTD